MGDPFGMGAGIFDFINSAMAPYQSHRDAMIRQHDAQGYDLQTFMSRYQMTVNDLKMAGLNPMLAYGQGGGSPASSPIGQGANFDTHPGQSYLQAKVASATEANIQSDTMKKEAESKNVEVDTLNKLNIPPLLAAQALDARSSAASKDALTKKLTAELPLVDSQINKTESDIQKNKSDMSLNESLKTLNLYKMQLEATQSYLNSQELLIRDPKARAAQTSSGYRAAQAEQQEKINKSFDDQSLPNPIGGVTKFLQGGR